MKTWELQQFGWEGLRLVDRDEPVPGPGQVVVRVRALSLNYRDHMVVHGTYNPKLKFPAVPLSDMAGEVVATGDGVSRVAPGDRVAAIFMQEWLEGELDDKKSRSALGAGGLGVASEYVVVQEHGLVRVPECLSYEEAASLPCAAVTAWNALVTSARLGSGQIILVQGTGGVSIFALQIAKLIGARAIVTSKSDKKLERARTLGAVHTINYVAQPDWDKAARELTSGRGVDHVVEVGGAGTMERSMRAVRPGGTISLIGVLAGRDPIPFHPIFMRNLRVQGIFVGSRSMFEDMLGAFEAHSVKPVIDRTFAFGELPEALRYMETGSHFGKICITLH